MAVYSCDHQAKGLSSSRPMGYRFHPTNRELMKYLLGFVRNEPLPEQYQLMQQVDLYADKEPWQIFDEGTTTTNNNTRYFITPQKKEKKTWKRFSRTVGNGTWKPQSKGKEVIDGKGRLMGYVKSLKYIPAKKSSNKANGEWLMTEYSLYDGYLDAGKIKNKGYVICKIKKKEKSGDTKKGNNSKVVNDENMKDVEEFIDSILQEEDINGRTSNDDIRDGYQDNNIEYLEGDQGEDHVLALLEDIDLDSFDFVL